MALLIIAGVSVSGCVLQNDIGQTKTVDNISCTLQSAGSNMGGWNLAVVTFTIQNNGASAVQLGPNNFGAQIYFGVVPFVTTQGTL